MLICTCPNELECPALLSDVVCFPWCEYLEDGDGVELVEAKNNGYIKMADIEKALRGEYKMVNSAE